LAVIFGGGLLLNLCSQLSYTPMMREHDSVLGAIHSGANLWGGLSYGSRRQLNGSPNLIFAKMLLMFTLKFMSLTIL
jgi:hypothetical protein